MNNRLYVGNLSFQTEENSIRDAFAPHGEVTQVRLMTDRDTGRSRGFAFVTMGTPEDAENAISKMNGALLDGRALRVNIAEDRRGPGGPRGGGGGFRGPRDGGGFGGGGGGGGRFDDRPRDFGGGGGDDYRGGGGGGGGYRGGGSGGRGGRGGGGGGGGRGGY